MGHSTDAKEPEEGVLQRPSSTIAEGQKGVNDTPNGGCATWGLEFEELLFCGINPNV
jgi:hypothetical protein